MTADLQSAVQRALSAWDTTTLRTNGDGMLSDAMESLRAEFDCSVQSPAEGDAAPWSKTVESAALLLQRCTGLELQDCENLAGTILGMAANVQPKGMAKPFAWTYEIYAERGDERAQWHCELTLAEHGDPNTDWPDKTSIRNIRPLYLKAPSPTPAHQPTNVEDAANGNPNAIRHVAYAEGYRDGKAFQASAVPHGKEQL